MTSTFLLQRLAAATVTALSIVVVIAPSPTSASTSMLDFDASMKKEFEGINTGDLFGEGVTPIGDVNGDGYQDLGWGARGFDTENSNAGAFYILLGKSNLYTDETTSDLIQFTGNSVNNYVGAIIAGIGDVDGDGFDDVLIGNPNLDTTGTSAGGAYLIYGRSTFNTSNTITDEVTFTGEAAYDYAGVDVASAGDVNNDGYGDFIIGATNEDGDAGRAYLFYGQESKYTSASLATGVEFSASGYSYLGYSVEGIGDINGDGFDDIAIADIEYGSSQGAIYVIYGQSEQFVDQDINDNSTLLTGESSGDAAGQVIRHIGDLNSDGYSDFDAGVIQHNTSTGAIYIVYGSSSELSASSLATHTKISGTTSGNYFGSRISSPADINSDGYVDLLLGETESTFILFGQNSQIESQDTSNLSKITDTQSADFIDLNGDEIVDTIFGSQSYNSNQGIVRIFYSGQWSIVPTNNTVESNTVECGIETYSEPGAVATDPYTGESITITSTGSVHSGTTDTYTVTYTGSDLFGISDSATRTITVEDTTAPTVTLVGESAITLTVGDAYTENSATVADACDSTVAVTTSGTVDTTAAGTYTITYASTDADNNTGSITRTVTVEAATEPESDLTVEVKTDGKYVRVFVDGELSTRKKIANKKLAKKYRTIKTAKVYKGKNYKTVTVVAARKKKVTVTTFRLTPNNTLTQKEVRTFDYNKRNRVSVSYKPKKKRIVVKIGKNKKMVTKTYKLTKKGKLKKV